MPQVAARQSIPESRLRVLDVPRSRDAYEGVAVNSLAFAGAFFAREPRQLRAVRDIKPLAFLKAVCQG